MRLVIDTVVMVAAIRSDAGASRRLLVAGLENRFTMLVLVPLLIEYDAVMTRRSHLVASRLSLTDVGIVLGAAAAVAEPVLLDYLWRPASVMRECRAINISRSAAQSVSESINGITRGRSAQVRLEGVAVDHVIMPA
jgi:hypothetical protein